MTHFPYPIFWILNFLLESKSSFVHIHTQMISQLADVVLNWQGNLMLNDLLVDGSDEKNLKFAVSRTGNKVFFKLLSHCPL